MKDAIAIAALVMSSASFLIFILFCLIEARAKFAKDAQATVSTALAKAEATPSVGEITDLVKAVTALTDSLTKAGPAITSILASILFLVIGAFASGALTGDHAQGDQTATHQEIDHKPAPAPNH